MLRFVAQGYDYSRAVFVVILCSRRFRRIALKCFWYWHASCMEVQ